MQFKPLQLIYQAISDVCDGHNYDGDKPIFNDSAKAVMSSILLNLLTDKAKTNKEEGEKQILEWAFNLKNFLNDKKNLKVIIDMSQVERGIYTSFIAYGNKEEKALHKEAVLEFTSEIIADDVFQDDPDLEIYNDEKSKLTIKRKLKQRIKDFLMKLLEEGVFHDYYDELSEIAVLVRKRKKISAQILSMLSLAIQKQLKISKAKVSKYSIFGAIGAGLLGIAIGMYGGFALIDVVLPISFGISGMIIGREFFKVNQINKNYHKNLNPQDIDINLDLLQKNELMEELKQQHKVRNLKRVISSEEMKDISLKLNATVKGVFSNEVDISIERVKSQNHNPNGRNGNNKGNNGGRQI